MPVPYASWIQGRWMSVEKRQDVTLPLRCLVAGATALALVTPGFLLYLFLVFALMPPGSSLEANIIWYGFLALATALVLYGFWNPTWPRKLL